MKNISGKKTLAESDLEEGEIPEFEICFGQVKDNLPMPIQTPSQECLKKKSVYFSSDKGGYELPCAEVEYVSEKPKTVMRNQVPQTNSYGYNVPERRLKYLYPFQATYGSVEHIMTKIGETLGRSNDGYYKGRIFNDSRSLIKLNNNIDAKFRESGSLFRRFRNNYHKKRRCSESNSDSDEDIWKTSGKLKSRNSMALRRKEEKDFRKKRKAKPTNTDVNVSEAKTSSLLNKSGGSGDDLNKETVKSRGNERLLRAIREIQKREKEAAESHDTPFADVGSNSITSSFLSEKDVEKPVIGSCDTINSDDNQGCRNYDDVSEKSSISGKDSDDDVELIKLRLLALTSNKRKNQVMAEEKIKDIEQKIDENSKSELTDDEKAHEKSPAPDDVTECKNSHENDIDSYELMLRAEALKTALLRKHKHRIKKRKYSSCSLSVRHGDRDEKFEGPKKEGNEVILSEEPESRHEESSFPVVADMSMDTGISILTISVTNNEINNGYHMNSENASNLENTGGESTNRVDVLKESTGVDHKPNEICQTDVKGVSASAKRINQTGKKFRRRLKKNSKLGGINVNELSIKENSGVSSMTAEEGDKKTKAMSPDSMNQKKGLKEHEKKFILVDSSQLAKFQSTCESKLPLHMEQSVKNTPLSTKANGVIGSTTTAKIPETEIQRIIVHLGSDSSDDEAPTQNRPNSDTASSKLPENVETPRTASTPSRDAQSKIVDYEKSVELLLKDARRKIEENLQTPQKIPPTPEAVYNHLAPSQRLEYIRLKQKIVETEKLRRMKENTSLTSTSQGSVRRSQSKNGQHRGCPTPQVPTKQFSRNKMSTGVKSLFSKSNVKDDTISASRNSNTSTNNNNKKTKSKNNTIVVNEVNSNGTSGVTRLQMEGNFRSNSMDLSTKISPKNASAANSVSVAKKILERKKTLTQNRLHLERLKVLWKNIKMEKMIEDKCLNELKRLKIQQNFFELKISQQRTKIKKLAEESKQIYEAFQKMNKGLEISGKKKKMIATEKSGPESRDSKVENTIRTVESIETVDCMDDVPPPQKKEENLVEKIDGIINLEDKEHRTMKSSEIVPSGTQREQLKEYNSPLQRYSTESESSSCLKVDPNTIMCQYDLTGRCNDEECPYQHLRC